jgi:hypothetical protein
MSGAKDVAAVRDILVKVLLATKNSISQAGQQTITSGQAAGRKK